MSVSKFPCAPYKLFEPDFPAQKPLIVGLDDRLESTEALSLCYEEEARVANGNTPRGESPPHILDMAAYGKAPPSLPSMHGYEATRFPPAAYEQYSQSFPSQQTEKFAQMNQQAFGSNHEIDSGVTPYIHSGPTVVSCQPSIGSFGTKVFLKISSQYDIFAPSSAIPYLFLQFGSEKCPLQDVTRESQDTSGYVYTCSAETPEILVTGTENNVPLLLLLEGSAGEEISRTTAGSFQYIQGTGDDITRARKMSRPESTAPPPLVTDHGSVSPKTCDPSVKTDSGANNYEDPSQQSQYSTNAFSQPPTEMISTYKTPNYTEAPYHRRSAPAWNGFHSTLGSTGRSPMLTHPGMMGRSSLTPLPMPSSSSNSTGTPELVRTSTITNSGSSGPYHHVSLYSNKAVLNINGKLDSMAMDWTNEEWSNRRRIVHFKRTQQGSTLTASFRAVPVNERPPNSICISCIWWEEKRKCYVTSVDTIHLLEQLVTAPQRFTVEEKNRIRRNLEGFHPLTVSKTKAESEEFFKLIMAFPNPKPRNIEKDVKVFPWDILESALKKIIGKYSANPSSTIPPPNMMPSSYATLPTPPGQHLSQPGDHHNQYSIHSNHHDAIPSPRSLSGSGPTWAPYATASAYSTASARTLSPGMRQPSPQGPSSIRVNTNQLPAVSTYDTRTVSTGGYGSTGLHTPISTHHPTTATPPRWDPTPASYPEGYPSLSAHHTQNSQSVYSNPSGPYSENGASRS